MICRYLKTRLGIFSVCDWNRYGHISGLVQLQLRSYRKLAYVSNICICSPANLYNIWYCSCEIQTCTNEIIKLLSWNNIEKLRVIVSTWNRPYNDIVQTYDLIYSILCKTYFSYAHCTFSQMYICHYTKHLGMCGNVWKMYFFCKLKKCV